MALSVATAWRSPGSDGINYTLLSDPQDLTLSIFHQIGIRSPRSDAITVLKRFSCISNESEVLAVTVYETQLRLLSRELCRGVQTLRTQDTSDPRHFGPAEVRTQDTSA